MIKIPITQQRLPTLIKINYDTKKVPCGVNQLLWTWYRSQTAHTNCFNRIVILSRHLKEITYNNLIYSEFILNLTKNLSIKQNSSFFGKRDHYMPIRNNIDRFKVSTLFPQFHLYVFPSHTEEQASSQTLIANERCPYGKALAPHDNKSSGHLFHL